MGVIPKAEFGRTGHRSTRVVFGAASLGGVSQKVADQTLEVLLKYGVNHIDTAAGYGDSELRIAPWLKREPNRFFLATQGDKRDEYKRSAQVHGFPPVPVSVGGAGCTTAWGVIRIVRSA